MKNKEIASRSFKDSFFWELIKLLCIPIVLLFLTGIIDDKVKKRDQMANYLKEITELASKASTENQMKLKDNPVLKTLARARTLNILRSSDDKQTKREIVEFLANSDLQYQFSLARADLHNADLHGLYLVDTNFQGANLSGANLLNADLRGAKLKDAKLDDAILNGIQYDHCTSKYLDKELQSRITELKWSEQPRDPKDKCRWDPK